MTTTCRPVFLAVRPADRWTETSTAMADVPVDLVFAETIDYSPVPVVLPTRTDGDALIVTSLRAILSAPECQYMYAHIPLYVVGESTARTLMDKGFTTIEVVAPTAMDLLPILKKADVRQFLYVRGEDVAVDFSQYLDTVQNFITYKSTPKTDVQKDIMEKIEQGAIDAVLFFSRASAIAFMDIIDKTGKGPTLATLSALCLSQAVLECVQIYPWARLVAAPTPDLAGMVTACRMFLESRHEGVVTPMSNGAENSLSADTLIERFGGIRPMAAKTGIAVTTVQGWKKRGVIPENRIVQIFDAARTHGIDLSGLPPGEPSVDLAQPAANDTSPFEIHVVPDPETNHVSGYEEQPRDLDEEEPVEIGVAMEKIRAMISDEVSPPASQDPEPSPVQVDTKPETAKLDVAIPVQGNKTACAVPQQSSRGSGVAWVAMMMLATAVLIGLLAMGPGVKRLMVQEQRLAALERELNQTRDQVKNLQGENAMLAGVVPDTIKPQIEALTERAQMIEEAVSDLGYETRVLTQGVMGSNAGTIEQRLSKVEGTVAKNAAVVEQRQIMVFLAKIQQWQASVEGRKTLSNAIAQMNTAVNGVADPNVMEEKVQTAFKTAPELKETLAGLEGSDLRTAMALLELAGFRQKLDRGSVSFDRDLITLEILVPGADLGEELTRLKAPARKGVSTATKLQQDFTALAPQIVAASLAGDNVSLNERAWARLHEMFRIERSGVPLTGTTTQRAIDAVQKELAQGDIAGAITALQALDGSAAKTAAAWVMQAENNLLAHKILDQFTRTLSAQLSVQPFMEQMSSAKNPPLSAENVTRGVVQSLSSTLPDSSAP